MLQVTAKEVQTIYLKVVESSYFNSSDKVFFNYGSLEKIDLGMLVSSVGFSVGAGGADSDNSEDRSSKSSIAASAPRERDRLRAHTAAAIHGKNHRTARARADRPSAHTAFSQAEAEAENSRSSVESDRRSSNAVHGRKQGVGSIGNGIHKVLSDGDDHSDEGQPSDEMRSTAGGYCTQSGSSVVGRLGGGNGDSGDADVEDTFDEGGVGKGEIGLEMNSCANPYAESILLLQRTQEALENGMAEFSPNLSLFTIQMWHANYLYEPMLLLVHLFLLHFVRSLRSNCHIFPHT